MGGKVTFNFGPKFKFPLKKGKPLGQASSLVFSPLIEHMVGVSYSEYAELKTEDFEQLPTKDSILENGSLK